MGVSIDGGSPKWLVYKGKIPSKMDDDWGYPFFRKPPNAHFTGVCPPNVGAFMASPLVKFCSTKETSVEADLCTYNALISAAEA